MSDLPIVISHYTVNTGYEDEVKNLIRSLERLGLEHDITPVVSLGSWRKNSNYCSVVVLEALHKHAGRNVLRVDADAVFHRVPKLLTQDDFNADVAAHVHDFKWHHDELLGGTIFFRNTPAVLRLVDCWAVECMVTKPELRNPDLLQCLLKSGQHADVKFVELPDTYCKIFDIMRNVPDPVIEHFQASRRFKAKVNEVGVKRMTHA